MPPASKMPTTFHSLCPNLSVRPSSSPENWPAAPRPTITSFRPVSNRRPSTMRTFGRTAKALGPTPRSGTFAVVLVLFLSRSTMTNSSAEATGPLSLRRTPAASATRRTSSSARPLTISLSAPERITMAVSGDPVAAIVLRNPSAMESTATKIATTPAMPTMATSDEVARWPIVRRFSSVTTTTCESQPTRPRMASSSSTHRRCAAASPGPPAGCPPPHRARGRRARPSRGRRWAGRTRGACRPSGRRPG